MSESGKRILAAGGAWSRAAFWDAVEVEIEGLDPLDFLEFLEAGRFGLRAHPGFWEALREDLRRLVIRLYST